MHPSRRLSRTSRNSKDANDVVMLGGTEDPSKMFMPSMSHSTMPMETPPILLPTSQLHDAPNFQISMPSSFQVNQPNFYTEVDTTNLHSNANNANIVNQPTSNFNHTADIDEDYDT